MKLSEQKEQQGQLEKIKAEMKEFLKQQNKNALIRTIFEQIDLYRELQAMAAQLLEENKQLKDKLAPEVPQPDEAKEPS